MPTPPVISDALLTPISAEKPSGEDLQATKEWVDLKSARPNPLGVDDKGTIWEPVQSNVSSWQLLGELASAALERRSKDLRIAIWLTEASIRLHQFVGLRDGLRLIRELVVRYWDSGLYPLINDGDVDSRCGPLGWLNEKMAEVIRQVPITARKDGGENYSFIYYRETRRPQGQLSVQQFNDAVSSTPRALYETMSEDFREAQNELRELEKAVAEKVCNSLISLNGPGYKTPEEVKEAAAAIMPPYIESKAALEEIKVLLDSITRQKRQEEPDETAALTATGETSEGPEGPKTGKLSFLFGTAGEAVSNGSWQDAERLVRAGQVEKGLAEMTRLAAAEPNGRARFHRKLLLAEICLSTRREVLAKAILGELAEQIDKFQLEVWESPALVGAVWSRLYRCYKNQQAGTADAEQAAKLFDRLCRLDPWQALACSEGKSSNLS